MSVSIGYFTCLPHKVLKVLPAAPAGQVLHNEAVFSANRWPVLIPAGAIPTAVASTFNKDRETNISFKARKLQKKGLQTGLKRFTRSLQTEPLFFVLKPPSAINYTFN